MADFKALFQNLSGGTEGNHGKPEYLSRESNPGHFEYEGILTSTPRRSVSKIFAAGRLSHRNGE
jgi:hypothetical protein